MLDLRTETLSGIKWSVVNSVAGRIIGFLLGVILARLLSPSDFGTVGMTAIFVSLASVLVDSGFSLSLVRKANITKEDTSTVFFFNLVISIIICSVLCLLSYRIALFLKVPEVEGILKVSAMTLVVGALGSVQFALLTKAVDFKKQAIITLSAQMLSGVLGIYLAYYGYGVWAIVWQSFAAAAIRTFIVWIVSDWHPNMCFSISSFKELFGFGGNLAINGLLDIFFRDGTGLIIGKYYTPEQLGFYSRGQSTAQLPSSFLYGMVGNVTFPVLAKIQDDDERLLLVYRKFMKMFSLIIFFVMTLLIAVAKPLTIVVFTSKWEDSIVYLQLFCFIYMLYHVHALNFNYLMVKGRSDWALKKELINKGVKFVLLLSLINFGVLYICIAFCISSVFDIIVNTVVNGHLFNYGFRKQCSDFIPYLLLSLVCCAPAFASSYLIDDIYISLLIGITMPSTIYVSCLLLRKDEVFNELIKITPLRRYIS